MKLISEQQTSAAQRAKNLVETLLVECKSTQLIRGEVVVDAKDHKRALELIEKFGAEK